MKRRLENILVTGGAGFIGSNFIHYVFKDISFEGKIVNIDKLTYAGNLENLVEIENKYGVERYFFEKADICDFDDIKRMFEKYDIDTVVNFAAESHVDRSIFGPKDFVQSNIMGTFNLLEVSRECWRNKKKKEILFHHISTDEVYGSIEKGSFKETDPLMPSSPYSASKSGADRLAYSYYVTYNLPVIVTRCSNNYGPFQYPEKLIPLFVTNAIENKKLPIYGDGKNIRDWIYVMDHCDAIDFIMNNGADGETYNIGGKNERNNLEITELILKGLEKPKKLMTYVKDRPGHDRRYSLDCAKLSQLGWNPLYFFDEAMTLTIEWYKNNREWWEKIKSGEYLEYYKDH